MNDKQGLYASDLEFIPVNCSRRRYSQIIDDMAIFCQRQGLNPRPQTSTHADTRILGIVYYAQGCITWVTTPSYHIFFYF